LNPRVSTDVFRQSLQRATEGRAPLRRSGETTAYRLLNGEGDRTPGITLDWFEGIAVLGTYRAMDAGAEARIAATVAEELGARAVYLKPRLRAGSGGSASSRRAHGREASAPGSPRSEAASAPICGAAADQSTVLESGLRYLIRAGEGAAVGLYLDMRDTRRWVRHQARSRRVLNCFAYTCAFGVSATAGGAARVLNIDLSRRALNWGMENARLNGQPAASQDYVFGDVLDWLPRLGKRGLRFDLTILDPPAFATSKASVFNAASWPRLVQQACEVIEPGGLLLASSNQVSLARDQFERLVFRGCLSAGRRPKTLQRLGASPIDFPTPAGEPAALKVLACQID
jgi:23S rRNA (cytosine1962-C5)-methyltransferase